MANLFNLAIVIITLSVSTAKADILKAFTLNRVNFTSHQLLNFDVEYDSKRCEFDTAATLKSYYTNITTGQYDPNFGPLSVKYFSPIVISQNANEIQYSFGGIEMIESAMNEKVELKVALELTDAGCKPRSEITYRGRTFLLQHINLKMKMLLKLPVGLKSVQIFGQLDDGSPVSDCALGECP